MQKGLASQQNQRRQPLQSGPDGTRKEAIDRPKHPEAQPDIKELLKVEQIESESTDIRLRASRDPVRWTWGCTSMGKLECLEY